MTDKLSHPADRILDGAMAVFERSGLGEGTMQEVATEAGVGRATLYRYFPGKDALISALVLREARRLAAVLDGELGAEDDPRSLFERGLSAALAHLRGHQLLQRTLEREPEVILPHLTVRGEALMNVVVDFASPYIERAVKAERIPPVDPRVAAEWAARIVLSLILTPSATVDLDDHRAISDFVNWIIPQGGQGEKT